MRSLPAALPGYERLNGEMPVVHAPGMEERASEVRRLLETGSGVLSTLLEVEPPELEAMLIIDEDWDEAPREGEAAPGGTNPFAPQFPRRRG